MFQNENYSVWFAYLKQHRIYK